MSFKWGIPATPAASHSASASPAITSKLGTGGGSSGLLGGGSDVGIVCLDIGDLGVTFCGGSIGKGGHKMCIASECTVASHSSKILVDQTGAPLESDLMFIEAGRKSAELSMVFVTPTIPSARLGRRLIRYSQEKRSVSAWETLFLSLAATLPSEDDDAEVERIVRKYDVELPAGMTPMKKRPRLTVSSPILEAGFEVTLAPLPLDLGPDSVALSTLQGTWKSLVSNMDTIKDLVMGSKDLVKNLAEGTEEEMNKLDYTIARIRAELGNRPEEWGTESMFARAGVSSEDLERLANRVEEVALKGKAAVDLEASDRDKAIESGKFDLTRDMLTELQPLFILFGELSSDKLKPGDKLNLRLSQLEGRLASLQSGGTVSSGSGLPHVGGVSWGISAINLNPTAATTPATANSSFAPVTATSTGLSDVQVKAKLQNIEEAINNIEAQLVSERVELGGVSFPSRAATKAWIKKEASADIAYVFFLDPHAFLNIGASGATSSAEQLSLQASAAKAGYSSAEEALVVSSYKFELPTFFGKEAKDPRKLPALPDFDIWDSKDGYAGVRYEFRKLVSDTRNEQLANAQLYLTGDGLAVAKAMIQQSAAFLDALEHWISQQYNDLLGQGGSEKECWQYVCHCVRQIFRTLHEARMPGRGFLSKDERSVAIVWGALQAHKKVQSLMSQQFSAHPLLSHVLNLHLRQHSVRKMDYDKLYKKVDSLVTELAQVKSVADKAMTAAKFVKK
jgi:hypothetical protein